MKDGKGKIRNYYNIVNAEKNDVFKWMQLVNIVKDDFPGLNKEEYEKILLSNIEEKTALCVKSEEDIVGVVLFSLKEGTLSFLAVHPQYRGIGIASALVKNMIAKFPENSDIWVTTYRDGDVKGKAARILYEKCGFTADELTEEFGYPCQKFVLHRV